MIETMKAQLKEDISSYIKEKYNMDCPVIVEEPKNPDMGDISVPVFTIVKALRRPLPEVVTEIKEYLMKYDFIDSISNVGGFINLKLNKVNLSKDILFKIQNEGNKYGSSELGKGQTVCIDYSSPNIAKSFTIGHLRSTIIGNSLKKIYQSQGYHVVGINHLGDWGTQFGKLIVAYKLWGDEEKLKNAPIAELTRIYVKFHTEAEQDESLNDKAREVFHQMELGNEEYLALWKRFREESLKEFDEMYKLLNVEFESVKGESFYNKMLLDVVDELQNKGLLEEDAGAKIVRIPDDPLPALIQRSDGGSLYMTRDLAAVEYRYNTYHFSKMLYVVGNEQKTHLSHMKKIIEMMGYPWYSGIEHVNFGLVLMDGKKMSTRHGHVVKLSEVIDEAIALALQSINEKNPDLENKEEIAKKIGVGAVVFNDLKNHRTLDYEFNLEQMLKFEGTTGPYLQYTTVRIKSILRGQSFDKENINSELFAQDHYFDLIKLLAKYQENIKHAMEDNAPSVVAKYLLSIAQSFNHFYSVEKINCEDVQQRNTNLMLLSSTLYVLESGMQLLGLSPLEKM